MPLAETNLFYRRPDLYDQTRDPADIALCEELVDQYAPDAEWLLDLGCGTAWHLERLAGRFKAVGVDFQPGMVDYAHQVRPGLDVRVGDLRDVRLGHPVDVIICLGNSLAYSHDNTGLQAAFATFAAHAHPGTLLVLYLPVGIAPAVPPRTARSSLPPGEVTVWSEWDLRRQLETMHRRWRLDDGTEEHDRVTRRVIFPRELEGYLGAAGFRLTEIFDGRGSRDQPLDGPGAFVVALA